METGLFIIRVVVGLTLAAHGAQKLFGLFGGYGITGTGGFLESIGFRPGRLFATIAGFGEMFGGLAFALGLLTPLASALIVATMLVAIWSVHLEKGFFVSGGGYEYNLVIIAAAIGITLTGPGSISVDGALGLQLSGVKWALSTVALGVIGALPALLARRASARRKTSAVNESSAPSANAGESRAG